VEGHEEGYNFEKPVTVCFPYDDTGLTLEEELALTVMEWDTVLQKWNPIALYDQIVIDTDKNTITAQLVHFSIYGIMPPHPVVSVLDENGPTAFVLYGNYPNPFNPVTTICFMIPDPSHVTVKIYNVAGRLVQSLIDSNLDPGMHEVAWSTNNVSSGTYFYVIRCGDERQMGKMLLMK